MYQVMCQSANHTVLMLLGYGFMANFLCISFNGIIFFVPKVIFCTSYVNENMFELNKVVDVNAQNNHEL